MRNCFYGYSQITTGPSYCPNSTLCTGKIPWATEQVLFHCCSDWWKVSRKVCSSCLGFSWSWPFGFKGVLRAISIYLVASLWHKWRQPGIIWPPPVAQRYHGWGDHGQGNPARYDHERGDNGPGGHGGDDHKRGDQRLYDYRTPMTIDEKTLD